MINTALTPFDDEGIDDRIYDRRILPLAESVFAILNPPDELENFSYITAAYSAITHRMRHTLDSLELLPEYKDTQLSAKINSIHSEKDKDGKQIIRLTIMYYQTSNGNTTYINPASGGEYVLDLGTGILKDSEGAIETGARSPAII